MKFQIARFFIPESKEVLGIIKDRMVSVSREDRMMTEKGRGGMSGA